MNSAISCKELLVCLSPSKLSKTDVMQAVVLYWGGVTRKAIGIPKSIPTWQIE